VVPAMGPYVRVGWGPWALGGRLGPGRVLGPWVGSLGPGRALGPWTGPWALGGVSVHVFSYKIEATAPPIHHPILESNMTPEAKSQKPILLRSGPLQYIII
jgi:hypothetical protein